MRARRLRSSCRGALVSKKLWTLSSTPAMLAPVRSLMRVVVITPCLDHQCINRHVHVKAKVFHFHISEAELSEKNYERTRSVNWDMSKDLGHVEQLQR